MKDFESGDEAKVEAAQAKFQELYESRGKFISEDMTGFVWLYVQK